MVRPIRPPVMRMEPRVWHAAHPRANLLDEMRPISAEFPWNFSFLSSIADLTSNRQVTTAQAPHVILLLRPRLT